MNVTLSFFTLCQKRAARERAQREREQTVFQYAGKDPKRADRVYGWGFAQTGALGKDSPRLRVLGKGSPRLWC